SWSRNRFPRRTARGSSRRATSGNAPSSTSKSPSSASRARRRVEATPETRFAPELLCATRARGRRISASIPLVVVFPFVAETSTEPWERRRASGPDGRGLDGQGQRGAHVREPSVFSPHLRVVRFALPFLYGSEAVPCDREHRSRRARRVPVRDPAPLHGRTDPGRAPRFRRATGALTDDEGVRGRPGRGDAPADRDRALRLLERCEAR